MPPPRVPTNESSPLPFGIIPHLFFLGILLDVTSRDTRSCHPSFLVSPSFSIERTSYFLYLYISSRRRICIKIFTAIDRTKWFVGWPRNRNGQKRIFTAGLAKRRKKRQFCANLLSSRSFPSIWDLRTSARFTGIHRPDYESMYAATPSTGCVRASCTFPSSLCRIRHSLPSEDRFRGAGFEADRNFAERERERETVSKVPGKVGKSTSDFSFRIRQNFRPNLTTKRSRR